MTTIRFHGRLVSFVTTLVLLLLIAPDLRETPQVGLAMVQSSRQPGVPVPTTGTATDNSREPVEVTFTNWVSSTPHMEGVTGGDIQGKFVGEILERQVSLNPNLNGIIRLEAIYEVQAEARSFTALIRGGTDAVTGASILDGVVLAGWRRGAAVHVEFETIAGRIGCVGAPSGRTCFQGIIQIGRAAED